MAQGLTIATQQAILNWLRNNASMPAAAAPYLALFVGDPEGAGTEVSGNNYSRQAITFGAPTAASPSVMTNSTEISFPVASGSWGTVTHWAIYDAATSGNQRWTGSLNTSFAVVTNSQIVIAATSLSVSLD